ncbi:MAG: hypothetical protein CVU05_13530 [Bacteroidetes bacterium HGW-Bacteroidetes-21]|nr:MAG: hypothetical protein CVU05_13530 [Bacteroidetes bacterium HGW-Bacteroidetes-21]
MRYFITTFLLFFALQIFSQGIEFFQGNLNEVFAKAKKENKFVFIDCYTTWCGPCKWLSANVFTNKNVGEFHNTHFINYKLDMEKGEGKDFRTKYSVAAYPTLLYLNPEGQVEHRALGAMDTLAFIKLSTNALDTSNNIGSYIKKYNSGNREPSFLASMAIISNNAGLPFNIEEYFATQTDEQLNSEMNFRIIEMYNPDISSREFKVLIENRSDFYKTVGEYKTENRVRSMLLKTVYQKEKSLDTKNLEPYFIELLKPFNLKDAKELAWKAEMDYNKSRSANWPRYLEIADTLIKIHGDDAFSPDEWLNYCENLIISNSQLPKLVETIEKNVGKGEKAETLYYKYYLIKGWLEYKKGNDYNSWSEQARKEAALKGISDFQFERILKQYFPAKKE